eukprot:scaffold50917_cov24-Tisochrysis_lutea.AAC.1
MAQVSSAATMTSAGVRMPKLIYGTAWKKERSADLVRAPTPKSQLGGVDSSIKRGDHQKAPDQTRSHAVHPSASS